MGQRLSGSHFWGISVPQPVSHLLDLIQATLGHSPTLVGGLCSLGLYFPPWSPAFSVSVTWSGCQTGNSPS